MSVRRPPDFWHALRAHLATDPGAYPGPQGPPGTAKAAAPWAWVTDPGLPADLRRTLAERLVLQARQQGAPFDPHLEGVRPPIDSATEAVARRLADRPDLDAAEVELVLERSLSAYNDAA